MPYTKQERRRPLEPAIHEITETLDAMDWQTGDLTFLFYALAKKVSDKKLSYDTLSRIRAALQDAHDEFYRRICVPYEDKKIEENGDVYAEEKNN